MSIGVSPNVQKISTAISNGAGKNPFEDDPYDEAKNPFADDETDPTNPFNEDDDYDKNYNPFSWSDMWNHRLVIMFGCFPLYNMLWY